MEKMEDHQDVTDMSKLDKFLEDERKNNLNEGWNKLNNGIKTQKLHIYAEQYAKDHKLPIKDVRMLKTFFTESIQKNKLQKTKEVIYDKNTGIVQNVPSLFFNSTSRSFTLRNMDKQRVSTLKSLTPKKIRIIEPEPEPEPQLTTPSAAQQNLDFTEPERPPEMRRAAAAAASKDIKI